jgi:hypothetical protein
MIPIGAIVGAALALSRAANGGRGSATPMDPRAAHAILRVLVVFVGFGFVMGLIAVWPWVGVPATALLVAGTFPMLTLTRLIVPLRLPRLAFLFASVSPPVVHAHDPRGAAIFFAALAASRQRAAAPRTIAWLEERLAAMRTTRGAAVAAAGLVAVASNKTDAARHLFASVDALRPLTTPRDVRRVARCWLVADAAAQGDWRRVAALGRRRGSYMRWPSLTGAIAQRLLRDPRAPSDAGMWLQWIVAPHRRATLPLLRSALRGAPPQALQVRPAAVDATGEPLAHALRAHAACVQTPSGARVVAAGRAWDAARTAPSAAAVVARRALALGARTSSELIVARVLETVETELAAHLETVTASDIQASATLTGAARRARQRDLEDIEAAAKALRDRAAAKTPLHSVSEWLEWAALRDGCGRLTRAGGADGRRTAFAAVYHSACNYAVWLFNVRGERLLANSVFRWLLAQAEFAGDAEAVKLLTKNVAAGDGA